MLNYDSPFSTWSQDDIRAALRSLEEQYSLGVTQVTFPDGGSHAYRSLPEMLQVINSLRARLTSASGSGRLQNRSLRFTPAISHKSSVYR
jgi:hypothetical protein